MNAIEIAAETETMLSEALHTSPTEFHLDSRKATSDAERDDGQLHVTEVVSDCLRAAFFRLRDVPRDYEDDEGAHWAHVGWLYEEWVRSVFRAKYPREVLAQRPVTGLPDGVTGTLDLHWVKRGVIFDVKSRSVNTPPPSPQGKEARQVATYAAHTAPTNGGDATAAVIIQIPREDITQIACYPVVYDRETTRESVRQRAEYLTQCRVAGTPPPPLADADAAPCSIGTRDGVKRCPWFSRCHNRVKVAPVPADAEMTALVMRHRELTVEVSALEKQAKELRDGPVRDVVTAMKSWFDARGDIVRVDGMDQDLKRIPYRGAVTYDVAELLAKRPDLEPVVAPYRKVGEGHFQHRYVKRK